MTSGRPDRQEHFCTMFDANFLPLGLALYESLIRHAPEALLWVVCLDSATEQALRTLQLPQVRRIAVDEIETDALRAIRDGRTKREYYWTLTPWAFDAVFQREPAASRVTYLDADLYFFRSPDVILGRMTEAHQALITHHAYAPEYDESATSGPFCVQFITVRRMPDAQAAVAWWRDRCLEWCYARLEERRFGDQRYLEHWPAMLGNRLLVLNNAEWTGAPWNACLAERAPGSSWQPVFYHFHGFRLLSGGRALLFPLTLPYEIGPKTRRLYRAYIAAVRRSNRALRRIGMTIDGAHTPVGFEDFDPWPTVLRRFARLLKRRLQPVAVKPIVNVR